MPSLPETYENFNVFHRFLFARCISPDRTIAEARHYIQDSLGLKYSEIPVLSLDVLWEESNCRTPLLGLLSSGADPTSNIQALAKKRTVDLFIVSMGQGQEVLARRYLQQTIGSGGWLLLQNAHLGLDYLDEFNESESAIFSGRGKMFSRRFHSDDFHRNIRSNLSRVRTFVSHRRVKEALSPFCSL